MNLELAKFLRNRGGTAPPIINEKAKREAAGLPPKKERVQVRAPQLKKLADAERVADEAIAQLECLEDIVRNALLDQGIGEAADPNLFQSLNWAKGAVTRLRNELEAI